MKPLTDKQKKEEEFYAGEKQIIIRPVKNSGLIEEPIQPKDYRANDNGILVEEVPGKVINVEAEDEKPMGGVITPLVPPSIIFPDGHGHLKYQGVPEMQFNRKFDTFSCVIFTIAKAICYNLKERYNIEITISEMFNAFYAPVIQGRGTTIRNGMESFRKHGWVKDADYPFTAETTLRQFQQAPPITIVNKATKELTKWKFNWEVVGKDHNSIIDALKRTVVVLTGFAWASYLGEEGIYFDYNNPANHAFLGVDHKTNKNIVVDDSYPRDGRFDDDSTKDEFIKELDSTYNFASAHRVWLEPILETSKKKFQLLTLLKKSMENFYYYWDGKHNFYYIGVPAGETTKYRQKIELEAGNTNENFTFIALKGAMNQSSWSEVSKFPDIGSIGKKFA